MSLLIDDAAAELADELGAALDAAGAPRPRVAVVLGSGLGAFADSLEGAAAVPFRSLPSMPRSTVPGHAGRFVAGTIAGVPTIASQGRVHLYEGHTAEVVTRAVRALVALGVERVLLTNAAGGTNPAWPVPVLMRITDHLNMQGVAPPPGIRASGVPYDAELGATVDAAADRAGVRLERGVYAGLRGPSYETAAEIRMLTRIGADAVGMSTVLEATAAAALGARVAAISCITNPAAGIAPAPLDHAEVVEAGAAVAGDFRALLREAVGAALA